MRNVFAETFYDLSKLSSQMCLLCADISPAGSMMKFRHEYPNRFINVGVAECSMIGLAAGMALRGMKPYVYTIATFSLYRPFEFVRNDICFQNLPVTIVGVGAGVAYSHLGATHNAQEDVALTCSMPNMTVIAPCDPLEVVAATQYSAQSTSPLYLRLGKAGEPTITQNAPDPWIFGKVRFIREGTDFCLLTYGPITSRVLHVAEELEKLGKRTAVVSVHTLKPLDKDGIARILHKFEKVFVVEEAAPIGGLASQVKSLAWDIRAQCVLKTFTLDDAYHARYGSYDDQLAAHGLDKSSLVKGMTCA
ncbi:MAG: transketolase [Proteobacteria bacterium]|nr:transketolase [Pseudomonadota bacterium]